MLWDSSCKGTEATALEGFFNNTGALANIVYGPHCIWSLDPQCKSWLLPQRPRIKLLDWLRKPDCIQSFNQYHSQHPEDSPWTWRGRVFTGWATSTINWNVLATTTSGVGCCNQCMIKGGNVDVYYWPAPDAKTACLSVVGESMEKPTAGIYTTDKRGYGYWQAPSDAYDGAAASGTAAIPAPVALGGPEDPFYDTRRWSIFSPHPRTSKPLLLAIT